MRFALITFLAINAALFVGCTPDAPTQGTGTATPPVDDFAKVGVQIDKADARVSAGVQIARNANAQGKPAVVEQELAVVASYLPAPDPHNLAYIANRVTRNDPAEYKRAMEAGAKLLAVIEKGWEKAEQDAAKNAKALTEANARVVELTAEVERVKTEGIRKAFTVAAGACFLAALGLAILGQYLRAVGAFVVGGGIGALPFLFASPYFVPGVAGFVVLASVVGALLWWFKRPKPDATKETHQD
jgi:uncharacterized small protein (DUF1192 family)